MKTPSSLLARRDLLKLASASALAAMTPAAMAQMSGKTIQIVVPWAPGGLVDTGGRTIADALSRNLKQPTAVENVPGAAGTIGADKIAKAKADGTALLMGTSSLAIDVAGMRKTPYDFRRDLTPVALVAETQNIVVVPPASPFQSLADLVAEARKKPGALNYGTPGIGSPAHLFVELFCQLAQIEMLHVPYNKSPALNDLIGGRLSVMFATAPSSIIHVRNKVLRPLAVSGGSRLKTLPEVPTVAEAGVSGYEASQWLGVFAPAATPAEVVSKLNAEITRTIQDPEMAKKLATRGLETRTASVAQMRKIVDDEIAKWTQVMRKANIQLT